MQCSLSQLTQSVVNTERRTSKVKHVRIQTPPPLSPDSVHEDEDPSINRVGNETHEGSPPPDPNRIDPAVVESALQHDGPFGRNDSEDEEPQNQELLNNTRKNSASGTAAAVDVPIIRNPFQKTLATMQHISSGSAGSILDTAQNDIKASHTGRDVLDVDSFKRLLLTGTKDVGLAEPSPAPSSGTATTSGSYFTGDSSSTDASSVSIPSVDEATSAQEDLGHETASSDEDEKLNSRSQPSSDRQGKPPPPKHRYGKSIDYMRTPFTVAFSEFTPTPEAGTAPIRSIPKPVPPTPPQRKTKPGILPSYHSIVDSQSLEIAEPSRTPSLECPPSQNISPSPSKQARSAPPPPLNRRTSHKTSQQELAQRTHTASPLPSPSLSSSTIPQPASKLSRPPPLPPSRRQGSDKPGYSGEPFPTPASPSADDHSRSSSVSSHYRATMPPPPPPPRRGSSKSSLDHVTMGTSGSASSPRGSVDDRLSRIVSLNCVAGGEEGSDGRGGAVLADMDALQAEIDALRAKYGTNR